MKLTIILKTAGVIASFSLIACTDKKEETPPQSSTTAIEEAGTLELDKFVLKVESSDALNIYDLRKTANAGDTVVFKGKVIGANIVFVKGRAMMILGDPDKLTSCDLKPGDDCARPWDVCCDTPKDIKENILTVQVLDAEGKAIKHGLKGLAGIKELSNVTVTGTVDKISTKENMVINATGIYVNK